MTYRASAFRRHPCCIWRLSNLADSASDNLAHSFTCMGGNTSARSHRDFQITGANKAPSASSTPTSQHFTFRQICLGSHATWSQPRQLRITQKLFGKKSTSMARHLLPDADGRQSDADGSDHTEDATSDCDSDTPRSCKSLHVKSLPPSITSMPSGATTIKESDAPSVHQGFSCTFDKYDRHDQGWGKIDIRMLPTLGTSEREPWAAVLEVKCRDVPRLMREGFFWSAENVLPEEGHISPESRHHWTALGCLYKRTWILADKSNDGQTPRWVGRLEVTSPLLEVLSGFRTQHLSRNNICAATAWNALEQSIYNYDHQFPSDNYNCIYDDKPLKGWWPWPRKERICAIFPDVEGGELFRLAPVGCFES